MNNIQIRGYEQASDFNFVINSWLKSYRDSPMCKDVANPIYFAGQGDRIEEILRNPETVCMIICAKDDPEQIIAYAIFDNKLPIAHYVYVKQLFRKRGLARMLFSVMINHHGNRRLHCTHFSSKLKKKDYLVFNPFVLQSSHLISEPINESAQGSNS